MSKHSGRARWRTVMACACALGVAAAVLVPVGAGVIDSVRTRASARTNAPGILIADPTTIQFPDPMHVALPDGRSFRLAHVVAPDPGTPEHAKALEALWRPLAFGGNKMRGLRVVGTNPEGEALVEMWGFQSSLGGCGNMSWSERRSARIPRWKDLTWHLVASGLYRLEPGEEDPELVAWQNAARRDGLGVWSDPKVLRQVFDLEQLDRTARELASDGEPKARDRRIEAGELLLRADPATYVPRLLSVVKDVREKDVSARIGMAQLLDKGGHKEGTSYLMDALRGRVASGLSRYELNSVVVEYQTFWNVQPHFPHDDHAAMVNYYDSKVRAGGTGG